MFVGWIRKGSFHTDLDDFLIQRKVDKNLVLNSVYHGSDLSVGAYDGDVLKGFITAYSFDKTILINNFYYLADVDEDIQRRMVNVLLRNIDLEGKTLLVLCRFSERKIFEEGGFKLYGDFKKAVYNGGGVAFNFTNATAKRINGGNYTPVINSLDSRCFNEERTDYILKKMLRTSSLVFSTEFGFQHSYGIGKSLIKISPWIMEAEAYVDAENLLRGVIYHRGLKRIVSFIPAKVKDITDLYTSYKFELVEDYHLMYKNRKPKIDLEMIYGF